MYQMLLVEVEAEDEAEAMPFILTQG